MKCLTRVDKSVKITPPSIPVMIPIPTRPITNNYALLRSVFLAGTHSSKYCFSGQLSSLWGSHIWPWVMLVSIQLGMMYSFAGTGVVEIAPFEREDNSSLACQMMISAMLSHEKTCSKGIKWDFAVITCIEQMLKFLYSYLGQFLRCEYFSKETILKFKCDVKTPQKENGIHIIKSY